jgi:hypothetical protein
MGRLDGAYVSILISGFDEKGVSLNGNIKEPILMATNNSSSTSCNCDRSKLRALTECLPSS